MTPDDYRRALRFLISDVFPVMGCAGPRSSVSVQYVGGEMLLYPLDELRECVEIARDELGVVFGTVRDGVQSNLIGSQRRILELDLMFGGNVGTSVDGLGRQRTVKGNPDLYRRIVDRSRETLRRRRNRNVGATFVMDGPGLANVMHEIRMAEEKGYSLYIRPVFNGGRDVDAVDPAVMASVMCEAFDHWVMKSNINLDPFTYMLSRRVAFQHEGVSAHRGCPFFRNCAGSSINIDPDGALYTCFEMADAKQKQFGDALEGWFDKSIWDELDARRFKTDPKCLQCPFFDACQGGCMSEALSHTGSLYGRTDLCTVWTMLFRRIDQAIEEHGVSPLKQWLGSLT